MPSAETLLEHAQFLRRLARGILKDADAAEDVAQEALVAGLAARPGNLRAWLGRVARNLALSRRRADARRAHRERAAARPEALPSAAEGVARLELQRRVVDCVLALDEPYRAAVVHRFFFDLAPAEIARRLGVPVETVRTRLRRALEQLRARLDASSGRRAWSVALLALAAPRKAPLGGLLAMSAPSKLAAAAVLALVCAALGIFTLRRPAAPVPRVPAPPEARAPGAPPPAATLAAPVDPVPIDRDRDVHGVVVDAAGAPVAGAALVALRYLAADTGVLAQMEAEEGPGTRTAKDGTFALRLGRGEQVDLRVRAPGFVPLQRRWCPAGGKVRIVLRKGVVLRVHAADPDGAPLGGARVILFKGDGAEMEAEGMYVYLQGVTDAAGTCTFTGLLPEREAKVAAWHPDFDFPQPATATLPAEVRLEAARGRAITGRVTDAATGAPVVGAVVTPYPLVFALMKTARTDGDGRYRFGGWGNDRELYVHAPGYASAHAEVGNRSGLDFALEPGVTVTGVVRDAAGAPVAGAYLSAMMRGKQDVRETRSDAEGRFTLPHLAPGPHVLRVARAGYGSVCLPLEGPEIEVVLPAARRLEGRVLGLDGAPLEGVPVQVAYAATAQGGALGSIARLSPERRTDDLGRFRFTDLAPVSCRVTARQDDRTAGCDVHIGEADVTGVELRFERGREFTVRVVDDAGRPVAGVEVGSATGRKRTDAEGRATFKLPPGVDVAQVYAAVDERYARPPTANYRFGDPELRLVLHTAAPVAGRVLLDGEPLAHAACLVRGPDGFNDMAPTDGNGDFRFRVPAGTQVDVSVTGQVLNDMQPLWGELQGVAAGTEGLVLDVRRVALDRTLRVRVVTPDGGGVPGMQIVLSDARGWRPDGPVRTDATGGVELAGLPAAEFDVRLFGNPPAPWAQARPDALRVTPQGQEIVFALRAAKPITGTVCFPEGRTGDAGVVAWRGEERAAYAQADENGRFTLYVAADDPEPLRVEVYGRGVDGGPGLWGEVRDVPPGTGGVTIQLRVR